jgi:hypothetical protein
LALLRTDLLVRLLARRPLTFQLKTVPAINTFFFLNLEPTNYQKVNIRAYVTFFAYNIKSIKTRNQGNLKIPGETDPLYMFRKMLTKIPTVVSAAT